MIDYIIYKSSPTWFLFMTCTDNCTHGEVNLVGGSYEYEGNVQVCINGSWSYICQNGWDVNDSLVACSQFGYSTSS